MNHLQILKDAFKLVKKNRYLWLLGILLGGFSGTNYFFNFPWGGGDYEKIKNVPTDNLASIVSANVRDAGSVLGDKISSSLTNAAAISLVVFALILILVLIYLTITAKGAMTWAIVKLSDGENFSLNDSWKKGHKYFWRRLSFAIIIFAIVVILIAALSTPVIILAIFELTIPAIILGIIFGLIFIAFCIYLGLFLPYSERILFLENKSVIDSLISGFKLFNKNWVNLLLMNLILIAIAIAAGFAILIAFLISGLFVFGIGALFYLANHILGYIIGGILAIALILFFVIVSGVLQAYNWSVLTLAYKSVK